MTILYGIPNCNSIKKAKTWLEEHQVDYNFHNYKKDGIDAPTLEKWTAQVGSEALLNKQSTSWRKLTDDEKAMATEDKGRIKLLMTYSSMIKRPIITQDGQVVVVGYDEQLLEDWLKNL